MLRIFFLNFSVVFIGMHTRVWLTTVAESKIKKNRPVDESSLFLKTENSHVTGAVGLELK